MRFEKNRHNTEWAWCCGNVILSNRKSERKRFPVWAQIFCTMEAQISISKKMNAGWGEFIHHAKGLFQLLATVYPSDLSRKPQPHETEITWYSVKRTFTIRVRSIRKHSRFWITGNGHLSTTKMGNCMSFTVHLMLHLNTPNHIKWHQSKKCHLSNVPSKMAFNFILTTQKSIISYLLCM